MFLVYYIVMKEDNIERVNVGMVKEHLSSYVTRVEKGERIMVCRRNRPVAELVPAKGAFSRNRTRLGSATGSVVVKCDLTAPVVVDSDWEMLR